MHGPIPTTLVRYVTLEIFKWRTSIDYNVWHYKPHCCAITYFVTAADLSFYLPCYARPHSQLDLHLQRLSRQYKCSATARKNAVDSLMRGIVGSLWRNFSDLHFDYNDSMPKPVCSIWRE